MTTDFTERLIPDNLKARAEAHIKRLDVPVVQVMFGQDECATRRLHLWLCLNSCTPEEAAAELYEEVLAVDRLLFGAGQS
jgi:hypothetical protein